MTLEEQINDVKNAWGYVLGPNADKIIKVIKKRDGKCPCRIDGTMCPCPYIEEDMDKYGHCHCKLFYKNKDQ